MGHGSLFTTRIRQHVSVELASANLYALHGSHRRIPIILLMSSLINPSANQAVVASIPSLSSITPCPSIPLLSSASLPICPLVPLLSLLISPSLSLSSHCRATEGRGNMPTMCVPTKNHVIPIPIANEAVEVRCSAPRGKRIRASAPRNDMIDRTN